MRAWNSTIGQFSYADVLNAPFAIAGGIAAQFAPPAYQDQIRSLSQPFSGTILDTPITIHGTLDVLGMVPVIGNVADVANGLLYLAEGNYLEAGLALAAAVPFAGLAAGGAKLAKSGANLVSGSRAVARISNGLGSVASVSRAGLNNVAAFGRKGVNAFADGVRNVANRGRRVEVPSSTRRAQSTSPSGCNSFVPGTMVLMADGSLVAIEDIELGDEVWATDPETGEEGPRSVEALIEGEGEKVLVEVRTADGGVFVATDGHPIWEAVSGEWTAAAHLEPGDVLLGEDGPVTVTGVEVSVEWETVHNLTVDGIHTYSVHNGYDEILTHNCGPVYGELDSLGRATGVTATLTASTIAGGTKASRRARPTGFLGASADHTRGHLLGKQLGGNGGDARNLVTQFSRSNGAVMNRVEDSIAAAVNAGQTVEFSAVPIFLGDDLIASGITLSATGSGGLDVFVTILNRAG